MHCLVKADYEDKQKEAEDLLKPFKEHFIGGYTEDEKLFIEQLNDNKKFKPPGEKIQEFHLHKRIFHVYYLFD